MIIMSSMRWSWRFQLITPSKTNMDTHNDWFGKCTSFQIWLIFGMLNFRCFLPDCHAETSRVSSRPIHHSSVQQPHPTVSYQYATRNHTPASSKWPKWRSLNPWKGHQYATIREISNRTHGPRTLKKPEFLIALASNLLDGSVGIRSHSIFDGNKKSYCLQYPISCILHAIFFETSTLKLNATSRGKNRGHCHITNPNECTIIEKFLQKFP